MLLRLQDTQHVVGGDYQFLEKTEPDRLAGGSSANIELLDIKLREQVYHPVYCSITIRVNNQL